MNREPKLQTAPGAVLVPATTCRCQCRHLHSPVTTAAAAEKDQQRHGKKRALTNARREQNRQAQKAFRERRKQQRQHDAKLQTQAQPQPAKSRLRPLAARGAASSAVTLYHKDHSNTAEEHDEHQQPSNHNTSIRSYGSNRSNTTTHLVLPEDVLHLSFSIPSLHRNTLRLRPHTIFSAILENGLSLGLDTKTLASCTENHASPFYRPSTPSDRPDEIFSAVQTTLPRDVPQHLRPTMTQVLIPHHVGLDLIPIPTLRDRAIVLGSAIPSKFDLQQLKIDIYQHEGLNFWSSTGREDGPERAKQGQPWEMESWEAAPWFLRKWRVVVDGEESDIWKQSVRFQSMRKTLTADAFAMPPTLL